MSEEHKALGYRPPPGSLAAEAQSAASKHPNARAGVDGATLAKVAVEDAKKIEWAQRYSFNAFDTDGKYAAGRSASHRHHPSHLN